MQKISVKFNLFSFHETLCFPCTLGTLHFRTPSEVLSVSGHPLQGEELQLFCVCFLSLGLSTLMFLKHDTLIFFLSQSTN